MFTYKLENMFKNHKQKKESTSQYECVLVVDGGKIFESILCPCQYINLLPHVEQYILDYVTRVEPLLQTT